MSSLRLANVIAETIAKRLASPAIRGGGPVAPAGYVLLVDDDGAYLLDDDGAYLMEEV